MRSLGWGIYKDQGIKGGGGEVSSIGRGFQQKEFGPISTEIKGILYYSMIACAV